MRNQSRSIIDHIDSVGPLVFDLLDPALASG